MSEKTTQNEAYEKLTPQRKALVDMVLQNLENGTGIWQQGWIGLGVPVSASTGKRYHGINNLTLSLIAIAKGYTDTRWATFHQMEERGWHFKQDENGKNLGKNAGVPIEFYELRDKETKKPFDKSVLDGMTKEEQQEYIDENVYPLRKYYRVFNGDVIEGIPAQEKREIKPRERVERADDLLQFWSDYEAKIEYGGDKACYIKSMDIIKAPTPESFKNLHEFYGTVLHEIGHSTGHEGRLNRAKTDGFGSKSYALEELRAELSAMFLEQDMEIAVSEKHIENNSRYIKSWYELIKDDPNTLIAAIADADKISRFVMAKEDEYSAWENSEPYAIVEDEDELGDAVYGINMISAHGQTSYMLPCIFKDKKELLAEFDKIKELPVWKDKTFYEVDNETLQELSIKRAELAERKSDRADKPIYELPSTVAAKAIAVSKPVNMAERGIDSLTKMSDIDLVERAKRTGGEMFNSLYEGKSMFGDEEKNEKALMLRIAVFCNGDKEQLLRVFNSSGQYHDEKPNAFYDRMAKQAIEHVAKLNKQQTAPLHSGVNKSRFKNAKV